MKKKIEGIEKSGFIFGYDLALKRLDKWIEDEYKYFSLMSEEQKEIRDTISDKIKKMRISISNTK